MMNHSSALLLSLLIIVFSIYFGCEDNIENSFTEDEQEIENIVETNLSDQIKAIKIYNLGQKNFSAGKINNAEKLYKKSLNYKPDFGMAHFALGNTLARKGDYLGGLSEMELALKFGFDEPDLYINIGIANICLKQYENAKENFQRALLKNSDDIGLLYNISLLNLGSNDFEIAKFYLKEVLKKDYYFENSSYLYKKLLKTGTDKKSEDDVYRARHILVKNSSDAEFILKKLIEGENFIKLAKQFSLDSNGKMGGDTGNFKLDEVDEDFGNAVKNLKKGELSKIVETKSGFHIILRLQ